MKQKTLLVLSILVSVCGIIVLFFLRPEVNPQLLRMDGAVKDVFSKGGVTFISFSPDNFTVVSFDDLDISSGNYVLVGRLQQYKGKVEFVVTETLQKAAEDK